MSEVKRQPGGGSPFLLIMMFILVLMIMFDPSLRIATASLVGFVLNPLIGFGGFYPLLTLFFAAVIMTSVTTTIRHFYVDWVEMARSQKVMSAFNKELRQATLSQNTFKIKKLKEIQPELMQKQLGASKSQMKLMPITMLIVIPIFAWIGWFFIPSLESVNPSLLIFSVPWSFNVNIWDAHVLPHWILLYSLFSIPFQQVLQCALKYFSFKKKLEAVGSSGG